MKKLELILLSLYGVFLVLNALQLPGSSLLFILFSTSYSMFYFIAGFAIFNNISFAAFKNTKGLKSISPKRAVASIAFGMAISVLILGVLFKVLIWPGWQTMLINGLGILIFAYLFSFLLAKNKNNITLAKAKPRVLIAAIFGLVFYFLPSQTIVEIKYRYNPELKELLLQKLENPQDTAAQEALIRYYNKPQ